MNLISVIIADDHEIFRTGLKTVLNEIPFVKVVAEASNGCEAVKLARQHKPDIILMDIRMPQMDGIDATQKITSELDNVAVIALTSYEDISYFNNIIKTGARGFLLKNAGKKQLEQALETVADGGYFFADEFQGFIPAELKRKQLPIKLTKREQQILELICKGFTNVEIADHLGISQKTVDAHRTRLMEKTGAKNAANLVHYAIKHGLV